LAPRRRYRVATDHHFLLTADTRAAEQYGPPQFSTRCRRGVGSASGRGQSAIDRDRANGPDARNHGELLIAGFSGSNAQSPSAQALADQIRSGAVGGVVFVKDNVGDRDDVQGLVRLFSAGGPRKVIVAIDHEGGAVQRLIEAHGCAKLPSARQVAADHTIAEAQALYEEAGRAVARLGFNLNLAPVVDLENAGNPAIGHYGRAFGGDADTVTTYAGAFVRGFEASGVCCVLKHFPGQGGAQSDSHEWAPDISAVWSEADLAPFRRLISERGVDAVMSGYSVLRTVASDGRPAALSREIVTGLLHDQLGFDGVAMTDDLDMGAVGYGFARRAAIVQALQAGNDALMVRNRTNYDSALPASIASWISEALADRTLSIDALTKSAERVRKLRNKLTELT
jgi:beta-N-acetylhexosaminidase